MCKLMTVQKQRLSPEFTRLVTEQNQQLRSFVRMLGVAPDWVDDLAQEAFLVAWRERDSFDSQRDIGKWLRGIARNLVRNELRKDARRTRLLHEGLSELLVRAQPGEPESTVWEQWRMSALRDCVEQLAPKSRKIVAGRYSDGWKAPDLADHLGMTAAAVRQALVRIRGQLKKCIELQISGGLSHDTESV
ncbi:MAG: sigma-70 family RNA polymerase sigma factor [bacterium]|nr:sigma-70 family RNA polymerase sigma factor [bacterium]